ncbi:MAG: hypothetical protein WBJ10_07665 [Daejeonella sp.]|uniref:hypothetical protein n=1 Tax=Daejeonella sp. TaxID=2805397 RepID=UPI003C76458B
MSETEQVILLLVKVNKNLKKLRKQMKRRPKMRGRHYRPEDWGLMQEVLKKLSISKSTLYRYRDQKKVRWEQKGGISYYYLPDLLKLKYPCMK